MKDSLTDYDREFEEIVGNLSDTVHEMSDPVAIATMLYTLAEERKSSNLVIRDINAKFDNILKNLRDISERLNELESRRDVTSKEHITFELSDRDREILDYVTQNQRVCADDIQEKFQYRGRNAASARLSKLFRDKLLEKVYVGRKVYYQCKTPG
jgi:predicted HTH transcriptional regulator